MSTARPNASHQEIKAKVGEISSLSAQMDMNLCILLSALLQVELPFSYAIMNTVTGHKVRRDIVMSVSRIALSSYDDVKKVERILRRSANATKVRNKILHATIGPHSETDGALALSRFAPNLGPALMHYEVLSVRDLDRVIRQITDLNEDTFTLAGELMTAKRQSWPGTQFRPSPPQEE